MVPRLRSIDDFSPHVAPQCPQLSEPYLETAIRDSMKKFFEDTDVYKREVDSMPLVAYQSVYDANEALSALPDLHDDSGNRLMEVVRVVEMRNDEGMDMDEEFYDDMKARFRGMVWYQSEARPDSSLEFGTPRVFVPFERSRFIVYPTPGYESSVHQVSLSLRPAYGAKYVLDSLFSEYYEAIAAGAIKKLCSQRRQPWSDPSLAAYYDMEYRKAVSDYKSKGRRRYFRGPVRLSFGAGAVSRGRR